MRFAISDFTCFERSRSKIPKWTEHNFKFAKGPMRIPGIRVCADFACCVLLTCLLFTNSGVHFSLFYHFVIFFHCAVEFSMKFSLFDFDRMK